jgi:hypothetical protein
MITIDEYEIESGLMYQATIPGELPGDMPMVEGELSDSPEAAIASLIGRIALGL